MPGGDISGSNEQRQQQQHRQRQPKTPRRRGGGEGLRLAVLMPLSEWIQELENSIALYLI